MKTNLNQNLPSNNTPLPFKRIVAVVGMPRSGTSWLSQIVDSSPIVRYRLSPFFSYSYKGLVDEHSGKEVYETVFRGAYHSHDDFMSRSRERAAGYYPSFDQKDFHPSVLAIKMTRFHNLITRMMELIDNLHMLALVRHPCGAIHSWLTAPGEFPVGADPLVEWRTGVCRKNAPEEFWGFNDWKKVTRLHLALEKRFPSRFSIVQYETLVEHTHEETRKMFDFLSLPFQEQTATFINASHRNHNSNEYSVFKKATVKDRWRSELNVGIQRSIISEITGTDLERFLV